MKNLIVVLILISALSYGQKLKPAVYWTAPVMSPEQVPAVARFDLLILDSENLTNNNEKDLDFVVASAALLDKDIYIAVGQNNLRWYPQFDARLEGGEEVIISRKFKNGVIKIFPSRKAAEIIKEQREKTRK
ncbi:MAG: hypothetical protein WC456_04330 [Patescibacteria group bacterium]